MILFDVHEKCLEMNYTLKDSMYVSQLHYVAEAMVQVFCGTGQGCSYHQYTLCLDLVQALMPDKIFAKSTVQAYVHKPDYAFCQKNID
jgi:hypothetical protein